MTESTAAFSRPVTPCRRVCRSAPCTTAGDSARQRAEATAPLGTAAPSEGLFTEILFPSRDQRGGVVSAVPVSREAASRGPAQASCPFYGSHLQEQRQNIHRQCLSHRRDTERSLQERRRVTSGGALAQAIREHRHERSSALPGLRYREAEVSPEAEGAGKLDCSGRVTPSQFPAALQTKVPPSNACL